MASSLAARGPCQRLVAVGVVGDDRALVYYELAASLPPRPHQSGDALWLNRSCDRRWSATRNPARRVPIRLGVGRAVADGSPADPMPRFVRLARRSVR